VIALSAGSSARAQTLTPVLQSLDTPVFMTSWPDNPNVLVVAERGSGKIVRYDLSLGGGGAGGVPGVPPSAIVLDLSSKVFIPSSPDSEFIGLTGFALHPEFNNDRNKRFLYVRYNEDNSTGNPPNTKMVIERYNIPAGTLTADPASAALVYENEAIYETTHAGGQIHFDTVDDGLAVTKLYFAIPDNAYYLADCTTKGTSRTTTTLRCPSPRWASSTGWTWSRSAPKDLRPHPRCWPRVCATPTRSAWTRGTGPVRDRGMFGSVVRAD
jgi:hypothetical protein